MHSHSSWDVAALRRFIGTTETLTLEFKSCDALRPIGNKSRRDRILEVARDVAGMANEQGGTIVYGLQESGGPGFHTASGLDSGFAAADRIDREWFLQVMRDNISPPLTDLDVVQVPLDPTHIALVVLVPQPAAGRGRPRICCFPGETRRGFAT